MARTLLIKPTATGRDRSSISINFEPLGLMYLAAFLRRYSRHAVSLIDAQAQSRQIRRVSDGRLRRGMTDEALRQAIEAYRPDVVGISTLFTKYADDALNVARVCKSVPRPPVVVVGGMDASARYQDYLRSGVVDLVVIGSGEETCLEILDRLEAGEALAEIPGTAELLHSNEVRKNGARRPSIPFDEYPFPARDELPRSLYDRRRDQWISFPFTRDFPAMLIQSSRGCPIRCAFCEIISVFDKWSAHGARYVVDEMEHCIREFGAREFIFLDDNFMVKTRRVAEICERIVERDLKVSIDVLPGVAVWTLTEPLVDLMIRAGLYRVCLPIESGNPETLRYIGKPVDLARVKEMIEYCNTRGLLTYANLILGFPFETRKDIQTCVDWAMESGLDAVNFFVAMPFRGSRMYETYRAEGWLFDEGTPGFHWRTQHFTSEELFEIAREASARYFASRARFFLKPKNVRRYLVPKVSSLRNVKYLTKVAYTLALTNRSYVGVKPDILRPWLKVRERIQRRLPAS